MGKRANKRKAKIKALQKALREKDKGIIPVKAVDNSTKSKSKIPINGLLATVAGIIVTTIGGNMLNRIFSPWGYLLFVVSLCVLFIIWTLWLIARDKLQNYTIIKQKGFRVFAIVIGVAIIVYTSQFYMDMFLPEQSGVNMSQLAASATTVMVYLGKNSSMGTSLADMANGASPFSRALVFGNYSPFDITLDNHILTITNTEIYTGENTPPATIKNGVLYQNDSSEDWKTKEITGSYYEVLNGDGVPVFQLTYKNQYQIIIDGFFNIPEQNNQNNLMLVNYTGEINVGPQTPYVYVAKRVSIRALWDIFFPYEKFKIN
jgi:hypothetical protein